DDFIALHSAVPRLKAAFLPLNYYSCEDVFLVGSSSNMAGPDILVGNSATPENNHLEVIEHLARLGTAGRKVIVPLSYGRGSGSELYAAAVRRAGERLLGDA